MMLADDYGHVPLTDAQRIAQLEYRNKQLDARNTALTQELQDLKEKPVWAMWSKFCNSDSVKVGTSVVIFLLVIFSIGYGINKLISTADDNVRKECEVNMAKLVGADTVYLRHKGCFYKDNDGNVIRVGDKQ